MKTIWKYEINPYRSIQKIRVRKGFKVLCARIVEKEVVIYAMVNPDESEIVELPIKCIETGELFESKEITNYKYLETIIIGGPYVVHIFIGEV